MAWSYITDLQSSGMQRLIDTESVEEPEDRSRSSFEMFVVIRPHINRKKSSVNLKSLIHNFKLTNISKH
jgi:hypothetical protein